MEPMTKPEGHPLLEVLMRFVRRALSPALYLQVEDHVRDCKECQKTIVRSIFKQAA